VKKGEKGILILAPIVRRKAKDEEDTVKELLGHSSVIVTMRYAHSNLASRVVAVGKLRATATIQLHRAPKCSS
jgi:hypothetical protein